MLSAPYSNGGYDIEIVFSGDSWCDMCKIAIAPRNAMSKKSMRISTKPLEYIFMDCIPSPGIMRGIPEARAANFLFITDPTSKYTEKLNVTDKSTKETIKVLGNWRGNMVKKGFKMFIYLRTDAGSNFTSDEFKTWCKSQHIELSIAGPKHQEQNAFAERAYGTASRMARSMLVRARLSLNFYHFALKYACKQKRVLPAKGLIDEDGNPTTTYAILHGKKPRIGRFKVFGCPCVFKRYQPRSDGDSTTDFKQLQKGCRGIFVGFADDQAGWLIYVPEKIGGTHLIVSMDVSFDQMFLSCPEGIEKEFENSQAIRNIGKSNGRLGVITEATGDITNLTDASESHWGKDTETFESEHLVKSGNEFKDSNNPYDPLTTTDTNSMSSSESDEDSIEEDINTQGSVDVNGLRRSSRIDSNTERMMMACESTEYTNDMESIFTTLEVAAAADGIDIAPYLPEPRNYRQVMQCSPDMCTVD